MKNIKISIVLDTAFVFFAVGIFMTVLLRFYGTNLSISLILSLIIALGVASMWYHFARKKHLKYNLKKTEEEKLVKIINELCLISDEKRIAFFSELLNNAGLKHIVREKTLYISEKKTVVGFYYTFLQPHEKYVIELYKKLGKGQSLIIFGNNWNNDFLRLSERFGGRIRLIGEAELFTLMKKYNTELPITNKLKEEKKKDFILFKLLFNKKRANAFFLYGVTLLFLSLIVFYPIYYLVCGGIFILYSVICKMFGKTEVSADFL